MDVEFDASKDVINKRKHGISLRRAEDLDLATAQFDRDDRKDYGEDRWNAIGFLDARLYVLTFTDSDDGTVRAISLRRATTVERLNYEENH